MPTIDSFYGSDKASSALTTMEAVMTPLEVYVLVRVFFGGLLVYEDSVPLPRGAEFPDCSPHWQTVGEGVKTMYPQGKVLSYCAMYPPRQHV